MPATMRIRFPFAAAFIALLLLSSSLGLLPHSSLPSNPASAYTPPHSDKALHFVCFFALTATFYFILDTSRRRVLHVTLIVCTLILGVGSEVLQGALPNDRLFDGWDVLANVLGSLSALGLAGMYHRRSAERRRRAKYASLAAEGLAGEDDLELGVGPSHSTANGDVDGQETGVVSTEPLPHKSVEEEVDTWDENAVDEAWDENEDEDAVVHGHAAKLTPATSSVGSEDVPRKVAVD